MPLYHVNVEFRSHRVMTIPTPVDMRHFEVEASDLQEAAVRVIDLTHMGKLPDGVVRRRDQDPYTRVGTLADPKKYDGMAMILHGDRSTLPRRVSIEALKEAISAYCTATGTDDEGDVEIGLHHLLHGLVDEVTHAGLDIDVMMAETAAKTGSGLQRRLSELSPHRLGYGRFPEDDDSAKGGRIAIETFATRIGQTDHHPDEIVEDMIHSMSALAKRDGFDLLKVIGNVAEDKAQADLDRHASPASRPQTPKMTI